MGDVLEDPGKGNTDVENTNLESNKSKVSLLRKGHRFDPFLLNLSANPHKCSPRSPSVHLGYLCRMIAMENCLESRLIHRELVPSAPTYQVISCGAGFDTTYFRLKNCGLLNKCHYVEIDYPAVIQAKVDAILSSPILLDVFGPSESAQTLTDGHGNYTFTTQRSESRLTLISCDLIDTVRLTGLFQLFGGDFALQTFIFSECVLTYVPADKVNILLRWIANAFADYHYVCYEQIRPNDTFGVIMRAHFRSRASPLLNVDTHPTLADQRRRLTYLSIPNASSRSLANICQEFYGSSEWRRFRRLETAFDEIEEMYLKCSHYSMFEGGTMFLPPVVKDPSLHKTEPQLPRTVPLLFQCHQTCRRYGHKVFPVRDCLLVFGGYSQGLGKRVSFDVISPTFKTVIQSIDLSSIFPCTLFCGAALTQCGDKVYVFGGRGSLEETSDKLLRLDFRDNVLQILDVGCTAIARRWKHTLNLLDNDDILVVIGGRNQTQVFKDIQCYSFALRKWRRPASLPRGLYSHAVSIWKGKVLISGGIWSDGQQNLAIQVFDPSTATLREICPDGIYIPRSGHTSHVIGSKLYLVGGISYQSSFDPGVGVIDLISCVAKEVKIHVEACRNKNPIYNHGSFVHEGAIYTVGGGGNAFSFGMHLSREIVKINPNIEKV